MPGQRADLERLRVASQGVRTSRRLRSRGWRSQGVHVDQLPMERCFSIWQVAQTPTQEGCRSSQKSVPASTDHLNSPCSFPYQTGDYRHLPQGGSADLKGITITLFASRRFAKPARNGHFHLRAEPDPALGQYF